eukprot:1189753-Prorocentrum_minimum.AAC.3
MAIWVWRRELPSTRDAREENGQEGYREVVHRRAELTEDAVGKPGELVEIPHLPVIREVASAQWGGFRRIQAEDGTAE